MKKIAWFFVVLATLFFVIGLWLVASASISASWPKVTGQITDIKIPGRMSQAGNARTRHIEYAVEVEYVFEWQGQFHVNNQFSYGSGATVKGGFNEKAEARAWLKASEYKTGAEVTVYVNDKDLTQSVLSPGLNWGTWVPLILSLLMGFLAYFLWRASVTTI